jgi:predicted nucleic acid-binding protein
LVKRYVAEPGSEEVVAAMDAADRRVVSRVAFVETLRAVGKAAGPRSAATRRFQAEWEALDVVEMDEALVTSAGRLAVEDGLRTLDALHLASVLALPRRGLVLATWDKRLARAARQRRVTVFPEKLNA